MTRTAALLATAGLGICGLLPACTSDCESVSYSGDVRITDMALLEGPQEMQIGLTVENGHDDPIYVIDSISRILVDDEERSVAFEMRPYVPDVIHVFQCAFCYREIPALSACQVRRNTFRTLTSFDGELYVYETDHAELEMAWGFEPFDPPAEGVSMAAFNDWEASIEDGAASSSTDRAAQDVVDALPDQTPSTECWTVYF